MDSGKRVTDDPAPGDGDAQAARSLSRRAVLGLFGAARGGGLTGCGGGGSASATSTATTGATGTTATAKVTPEGEIGPYFTDDSAAGFSRSNILANLDGTDSQAGIPLALRITVVDSENGGAALAGAQVDIWHCNAEGVYSNESGEGTLGQTWLRGYQITDANGLATFTTIIPGWYEGRTTHIHLRVRSKYSEASSTSDGANTTQVFFPQATLDYIYTNISPYNAKGKDTTTNVSDHVYTPETEGETELALAGDYTNGYTSAFTVRLPITAV